MHCLFATSEEHHCVNPPKAIVAVAAVVVLLLSYGAFGLQPAENHKRVLSLYQGEISIPALATLESNIRRSLAAPAASSIEFAEPTFWGSHKTAVVITVAQSFAIAALLVQFILRRRMGRKLRRSERKFKELFDSAVLGMYQISPDGRVLMANPALCRLLKYDSVEQLQQHTLDTDGFHPDYPRTAKKLLEEKDAIIGLEACWTASDGSRVWVRENARAFRDRSGNVLWYEGTVEDITDAVLAQQALRESEARFRSIYQQAGVGIEQVAPDGRLIMVNPALCGMLGYTESELLDTTTAAVTHPDDRDNDAAIFRKLLSGQCDSCTTEKRYLHRNGSAIWVNVTTSAVRDAEGRLLYGISIIGNISERKQAEEAVRALSGRLITAQEEERARIAREIHDDFAQRLALLKIQQDELRQSLPPTEIAQHKLLTVMSKQVGGVATDLRRLSHKLHSSTLRHVGLLAAIDDLCIEISMTHGIPVHLIPAGVPSDLPADLALCIFRAAQEALANVAKHSGASEAQVTITGEFDRLVLRIKDNGHGFQPESQKAGLGLISVRERVHLIGGTLEIQSQPENGTELIIVIPLRDLAKSRARGAALGGAA